MLNGHRGCVNTIRWSSDGEILVSGSDDMMVHLWRLGPHLSGHATRPSACLPTLHRHNIFDAIMTGDKQSIVSCGADGYVCLTDIYSGQKMKLFEPDRGHFFAFKIATLPDSLGRTFLSVAAMAVFAALICERMTMPSPSTRVESDWQDCQ